MQLGTRWKIGAEPPSRVPEELVVRIREVEASVPANVRSAMSWTLTWLEGRPVVELDDGTVVTTREL
jgi:hypothetical protein